MHTKTIKMSSKDIGDREPHEFVTAKVNKVKMSDISGTSEFIVDVIGLTINISYKDIKPLVTFTSRLKKLIKSGNPLAKAMRV